MGGDHAPAAIVEGARQAVASLDVEVTLVGRADDLAAAQGEGAALPVHPASQVIGMGDDPARSVRTMKDSSLVRAAELVRDGAADVMLSAGNTGAAATSALLRMGRLPGVARPAIVTPIPVPGTTPTVLLDAGAMADCQAGWLEQFARMGSVYARQRYGIEAPRVGLLSIGEEPGKGNALVKEAYGLLEASPVRFVGNVEGRDIMTDAVDVVVTDGFTGNVALKCLEGSLRFMVGAVTTALAGLPDGGAEALDRLAPLAVEMDPESTGGAILVGVDGLCVISHGSSSPDAIVNACRVSHDLHRAGLTGLIGDAISEGGDAGAGAVVAADDGAGQ